MSDDLEEYHICTCGDCEVAPYRDQCKYEISLRDLKRECAEREEAVQKVAKKYDYWMAYYKAELAGLREAARLVVDPEYRLERRGPQATIGSAIEGLRHVLENTKEGEE